MSFKRKNPGNQSIRRQLTFYMGLFVVLPLCLALMLLNFYLQKVTTENKINNETDLLSQIRDNTDQMIEVTNYATSMLMTNKNIVMMLIGIDNLTNTLKLMYFNGIKTINGMK